MVVVVLREANTKEVLQVDMGAVMVEDMAKGEVDPPEIGHVLRFCTNLCVLCAYCYSLEHVIEDYPDLVKKWEENKTHCNMVHAEPRKNNKNDEEVYVRVVTRGGAKIGRDCEKAERLS
jgi:hypothetical protein